MAVPSQQIIQVISSQKFHYKKWLTELLKWWRVERLPNKPETHSLNPTTTRKNSQRYSFNLITNKCLPWSVIQVYPVVFCSLAHHHAPQLSVTGMRDGVFEK
jgi:hypothetical protein